MSTDNLKVGRNLQNADKSGLQFLPGMIEWITDYCLFKNIYCLINTETSFEQFQQPVYLGCFQLTRYALKQVLNHNYTGFLFFTIVHASSTLSFKLSVTPIYTSYYETTDHIQSFPHMDSTMYHTYYTLKQFSHTAEKGCSNICAQ